MKKIISFLLAVAMCATLLVGCASGEATPTSGGGDNTVHKWTYQLCTASGTPYWKIAEKLVQDIKEATNGRILLDLQPLGSIAEYNQIHNAVKDGSLDMASYSIAAEVGLMGKKAYLFGGSGSPGGFNPQEFLAWTYQGGGDELMKEVFERYGVTYLTMGTVSGAELFCHSNVKLEKVSDFKGVKFRTMGMWADILNSIGASVVNLPGGEIYQAMDRKLIDAFEYCGPAMNWDMGFQEVGKYIGTPGIHSPTCAEAMIINPESYKKLSPELQKILYEVVKASCLESPLVFAKLDAEGFEKFKEYGTEVFTISDETQKELIDITYKLQQGYMAEDPEYKKIFEHQRDFLKTYKGINNAIQIQYSTYDK